ncbi:MAG: YtxH domain-containing protein [Candidatus Margulisbacteria bacterium]|nr:YtxH domain-containing protein [Candidatus Margulisiibacteriota bacterium]
MSKSASFLGGIIFGAIAGAVAGVLLAPTSGKESRDKLKDKINDFKEDGKEYLGCAKEKTETMIAKTLDAIDNGFEKLGKIVDERNISTESRGGKS